ncbi:DUF2868 domain-containing protein [Rhizobacter fulvus]
MNEDSARAVTLLQAFETAQPPTPNWGDDDRAWATRLALQEAPANAADFIARRAHHALQRLGPREPAAARWLARRLWDGRWVGGVALGGVVLGVLADSLASDQRINLLAPPLWGVLAWNAVVYLLLLGHGLARALRRPAHGGALLRLTERAMRLGRRLPTATGKAAGTSGPALQAFAAQWWRVSAPLSAARAATLLHAAAAALAVGLIVGLYLRGLALDYRVAWESTFLSAGSAHAAVTTVLAPASALSGIPLPDAAGFEALRVAHGAPATAPAAPWIHLLALTLALFVVAPRSVLAVLAALRAQWHAARFALPLGEPYFQRLARLQQGDVAQVAVLPYASAPGAHAVPGLQALLMPALGDGTQLRVLATTAFGTEDESTAAAELSTGTTLAIALFDLSATPERENQGRFAQRLAARAPAGAATVVLVDETAFAARFAADPARLAQRREAWRLFADSLGTVPVFAHLAAPDTAATTRALQLAMRSPVARSAA